MRQWRKVKHCEVADAVSGVVVGPMNRPDYVVVGLPVKGRLRIVGRSTALTAKAARELVAYLHPPQDAHPWPEVITETTLNRFSKDKGPVSLTLVEPLVVESSADVAWSGNALRHAVRYLRRRPELAAEDVQLPGRQSYRQLRRVNAQEQNSASHSAVVSGRPAILSSWLSD